MSAFKIAERKQAKLRLALCGPSGSGKTFSALLMAKGLSDKIAVIDTERGSAELYSHLFPYDAATLEPPYGPQRYIKLLRDAESAGYDVVIIDSLSHAWAGEGGMLEMHENATQADRQKNSYAAWRKVTPEHNKMVDAILQSPCHVICTLRTKTAYELIDDGSGKKKPIKLGMAPIFRDGIEYEFTFTFDLGVDNHLATCSKDRSGIKLFDGQSIVISQATGATLKEWLSSGVVVEAGKVTSAAPADEPEITVEAIREAFEVIGITKPEDILAECKVITGNQTLQRGKDISHPERAKVLAEINKRIDEGNAK